MRAAGPRMRRPVVLAMSGISVVVMGATLKASDRHAAPTALGAAAVIAVPTSAQTTPPVAPQPRARPVARPRRTTKPSVTVNGGAFDTQYGPVQVRITVRGGRITAVDAIAYPQSGSRDQEINRSAVPQLDKETLDAQSAQIDTVSGATYTSEGYRSSLQSALDAAHQAGAL